jgi:uncharacterized membrane protein YidH (DUF202 family)
MRVIMNTLLFLTWIAAYLSLAYGIVRYRRAQACALGMHGRGEYRAEKDPWVRIAVFLVGILLCVVVYFVLRVLE